MRYEVVLLATGTIDPKRYSKVFWMDSLLNKYFIFSNCKVSSYYGKNVMQWWIKLGKIKWSAFYVYGWWCTCQWREEEPFYSLLASHLTLTTEYSCFLEENCVNLWAEPNVDCFISYWHNRSKTIAKGILNGLSVGWSLRSNEGKDLHETCLWLLSWGQILVNWHILEHLAWCNDLNRANSYRKTHRVLHLCLRHPPPVCYEGQCHIFWPLLSVTPAWSKHAADTSHAGVHACHWKTRDSFASVKGGGRARRQIHLLQKCVVIRADQPSLLV